MSLVWLLCSQIGSILRNLVKFSAGQDPFYNGDVPVAFNFSSKLYLVIHYIREESKFFSYNPGQNAWKKL